MKKPIYCRPFKKIYKLLARSQRSSGAFPKEGDKVIHMAYSLFENRKKKSKYSFISIGFNSLINYKFVYFHFVFVFLSNDKFY